jgi:hypothetical protein
MKLLKKLASSKLFLAFIFTAGLVVRLYRLNFPIADWHSWRQSDTAAVTARFLDEGVDLLQPKYFDISNIQSGKFNPQGYRMVEFPIFNLFHYLSVKVLSFLPITFAGAGRLVSVFSSLSSAVFLFLLIKKLLSRETALAAVLLYLFLPFNIFYSRTVLPETLMVCFSLSAAYFYNLFLEKDHKLYLLLFTMLAACAFLIKPTAGFFFLPFVYLTVKKYQTEYKKYLLPIIAGVISITPFLLWRQWIQQYPEGIPAYTWLLNGDNIRLRPAFFRWLFAERIGKLILGYYGLFFLGLGLVQTKKEQFPLVFLLSFILYMVIFATGNVRHDYYQIIIIPALCTVAGMGIAKQFKKGVFDKFIVVAFAGLMLAFSFYEIRGFFNINNPAIVKAGKAVQKIVPKDVAVIAPYNGDTAFLNQTRRRGWPIGFDIGDKIEKGAEYYVSVNYDDETRALMEQYSVKEKTADYVIIRLKQDQ